MIYEIGGGMLAGIALTLGVSALADLPAKRTRKHVLGEQKPLQRTGKVKTWKVIRGKR